VKEKRRKKSEASLSRQESKDLGREPAYLTSQLRSVLRLLRADRTTYLIYILLYIPTGIFMNTMGKYFQIGEYAHWWQVLTCYGLYLIPASLLVRKRRYFDQYLAGLLIIAILELPAYSLGTSIAHPNSILDQYLTPRNYSLFMTVFFAGFIPLGNWAATAIRRWSGK
jgi:uncharacterized membrane protein YhaH (DUF805 family)